MQKNFSAAPGLRKKTLCLVVLSALPGVVAANVCTTTNNQLTGSSSASSGAVCSLSAGASVTLSSTGQLTASGSNVYGIYVGSNITAGLITNAGTITTGTDSRGIGVDGTSGAATATAIINTGTINAQGHGIEVTAHGYLSGVTTASSAYYGDAIYNSGTITTTSAGWGDESAIRIADNSTITGDIVNASTGVLTGRTRGLNIAVSTSQVSGSIYNYGSMTGTTTYGIYNIGTVTGSVYNYATGTITGGTYAIYNVGTISGGIYNYGTLTGAVSLGGASLYLLGSTATVSGAITGNSSSVLSVGSASTTGSFTASAAASAGYITVASGSTLTLGSGLTWTASTTGSSAITINGTAVLSNLSSLSGNTTNTGTLKLASGTVSATLTGNLSNAGTLVLNPTSTSAGNTLTITGNYVGSSGSAVYLGTVVGADSSTTDKLVITGNASGQSTVYVSNENGSGAQTVNGIKIIEVDGTSSITFTQGNRVVAGAYEYSLVQRSTSWYLSSALSDVSSATASTSTDESLSNSVIRPEVAAYASNVLAANTLFNMSYADRIRTPELGSLWLRTTAGNGRYQDSSAQLDTRANRHIFQIGKDILQRSTGDEAQASLGWLFGYGRYSAMSHSNITGYGTSSQVEGYAAGIYDTWLAHPRTGAGSYFDSWAQWSELDNAVQGNGLMGEAYKAHGLSASMESGYGLQIAQYQGARYWLKPQAQMIWMNVQTDEHTENTGTVVAPLGKGHIQTRTGLRTYVEIPRSFNTADHPATLQAFAEANWIRTTKDYGITMNGAEDTLTGQQHQREIKVGFAGDITHSLKIQGTIGRQWASPSTRDLQAALGMQYQF